ncbi:MAG: peptidoglycan-binding domain-containing protein [Patescibacteria group bacterium]
MISRPSFYGSALVLFFGTTLFLGGFSLGDWLFARVDWSAISLSRKMISGQLAVVNPPAGCPAVSFDSNLNFVLNGQTYFPFGFWAFSGGPASGNWSGYNAGLNAAVDGPEISSGNTLMGAGLSLFAQVDGSASLVESYDNNQGIIAWEVTHEPNSLGYSASTIASQASAMRDADECGRPVFVTPSLGGVAEGYLNQVRNSVDFAAVETGYLVPQLPIEEVGELFSLGASAMSAVSKPSIFLLRVNGYQPARYRETYREPSIGEMRAQIFDAIIRGAKGVLIWPFEKGVISSDLLPFEPANAIYDMEDSFSSGLYNSIKSLASEVLERKEILTAPNATGVSVSSNNSDVRCGFRALSGDRLRLVCVNLSQDHSPYFDYGSGETVWRTKAKVTTPASESFPADYNSGSFVARELDPNSVTIQDISTGITNQDKIITTVEIDFDTVPVGAIFTYAIYADNSRDQAPDTRVFLSSETTINGTGAQTFPVAPTTLEHTKNYYLLIKAITPGIKLLERDVRGGVRVVAGAGAVPLTETFADLHEGDSASNVRLTLSGQNFSTYCAEKNFGNCASGTVSGNVLTDSFNAYAVHIYHFDPEEEEEEPPAEEPDELPPAPPEDPLDEPVPPPPPPPNLPPAANQPATNLPTLPVSCLAAPSNLPALVGPLSFGMKNNTQVTLLQRLLATDPTLYPEGVISGYYGPLTREAVKRFQLRYGILNPVNSDPSLVGFAGPATRAKMNEVLRQGATTCAANPAFEQTRQFLLRLLWQLSTQASR